MLTLLQATTRRDAARKALSAANSPKSREKAMAALETATLALARVQSAIASKTVKTVKKEERYEEEDDAEEEEDEDEEAEEESKKDDEPKAPAQGDDSDDADDDGDDDDMDDDEDEDDEDEDAEEDEAEDEEEDEEEEEDEDEEARAAALMSARTVLRAAKKSGDKARLSSARAHLKDVKRVVGSKAIASFKTLKAACQRITGKRSMKAVLGALDALAENSKATEKLSADLSKLKSSARRSKVDAMLQAAKRDGKISPAEIGSLRQDGMKQGTRWLRAHLDVRPKLARSIEDGGREGRTKEGGKDGDAKSASDALTAQNISPEQRKVIESMCQQTGKDFDTFLAEMNKNRAKSMNGAH